MAQTLPAKETALFRNIIQLYEIKQYKKALKAADQILKKFPKHADTQALKALVINSQGSSEAAFALAKEALLNDMKSHICWHVYGLLYRSVKNVEEAVKAYKRALKLAPDSPQITRDLALLQLQLRDYKGYIETRQIIKDQDKLQQRQSWSTLAVGHHLAGELDKAEAVLDSYDELIKDQPPPPPSDLEYGEMCMYKNRLIAESGDYKRALEHLESIAPRCFDRTGLMERRAEYQFELGQFDDAVLAYRALLERNCDRRDYFVGLEKASRLDRSQPADHVRLLELYDSLAEKYPTSDAARRMPLDFLRGAEYEKRAEEYVRALLRHAVPTAFSSVRNLSLDPERAAAFTRMVDRFIVEVGEDDNEAGREKQKKVQLNLLYFIAQYYDHAVFRHLGRAEQFIDRAIALSDQTVDLYITKAKILKHKGDLVGAAAALNKGRELMPKDRNVSTRATKYYLRINQHDTALDLVKPFLRPDAPSGPLGDLFDMQSIWYLTEDGLAYAREANYNLALKRFRTVTKIYDVWFDDQFDFHAYSFRKGSLQQHLNLMRWEDSLFEALPFTRAALAAVDIYIRLADEPRLGTDATFNGLARLGQMSADSRKKATKAAGRLREKAEAERKELERKAASKPTVDGESKRPDQDPLGLDLIRTKAPLEEAEKLVKTMLRFTPDAQSVQLAAFDVFIRQAKFGDAVKAVDAIARIASESPELHVRIARLVIAVAVAAGSSDASGADDALKTAAVEIPTRAGLEAANETYLAKHAAVPTAVHAGLEVRRLLKGSIEAGLIDQLIDSIGLADAKFADGVAGLEQLRDWKAGFEAENKYKAKALARWPDVSAFLTE